MSIEKDLSRIADALERLADLTQGALYANAKANGAGQPAPQEDPIGKTPEQGPKTVEELRNLAADIVGALGENSKGPFTDFVRGQVCGLRSVRKLAEIPVDQIPAAAKEMKEWAKNAAAK